MEKIIAQSTEELALRVANEVAQFINGNPQQLLCFAAGDTPLLAYRKLIDMQREGKVNLNSMYYVGLDEWVGLGYRDRGSCAQVMTDNFYAPAGIDSERMVVFNGLSDPAQQCEKMADWISKRGGIALTVLGIGMNGHVGFNEPPASDADGCIIVPLDETTRKVSKKYFDTPLPVELGVTIALNELMKAKRVIMMASGENKRAIVQATINQPQTPAVPSSMMRSHPNITIMLDADAAEML